MPRFSPLSLVLACGASLGQVRGTVVDARGGEPLARVRVTLAGTAHEAVTGPEGRFEIAEVAPGDYQLNVATVGYRMLKKSFSLAAGEIKEFEVILSPDTFRQTDSVEVRAGPFEPARQDSPSQRELSGTEAKNLSSVLADDPLRAVQSLPGVTSNDDFNAQFSLRGADYHRLGVYLDGVLLHAPFHAVQGTTAGSITIFNGDMVEDLALHPGAYPARFADRTAGALEARTREGSRGEPRFRATGSFSNAGVMGEGPLGKRGSWLAGARKSYLQYLIGRTSADSSIAFGFTDTQGRISYDVAPRHNLSLNWIEGHSDLDRSSARQRLGINSVMTAGYHFTLGNLAWRYTPRESVLVTNRVAWLRERFTNGNNQDLTLGAGLYGEWIWHGETSWAWNARNPLEVGWTVRRVRDGGYANRYQFNPFAVQRLEDYRGSALRTGGYVQQSWSAWDGRLHGAAGGRWDRHPVSGVAAFSPHASLGLVLGGTRFDFGWGQYVQFPELSQSLSRVGSPGLLPERANQAVAAVERRLGERTRLRLEFYEREDRDLLFRPLYEPRIVGGGIFNPPVDAPWRNSLRGYARGVEVFLQRRSANRLTGWVSYALGYARLRDGVARVSFPSDQDQRHTVNVFGGYRVRPTVNVSVRWLYGSGFPVPGFLRWDGVRYLLDAERNAVRMGAYQRTDVRVNKSWAYDRWKLTLYGEVVEHHQPHEPALRQLQRV